MGKYDALFAEPDVPAKGGKYGALFDEEDAKTGYTPPLSPEQQSASITKARQDAVKSLPIGARFAAGVGKGLMDTYAGLGQLATRATDAIGITDGANKKLTQAYQGERDLYESATQGDVASRVGEIGGNLALGAAIPAGGSAGLVAKAGTKLGGLAGRALASTIGRVAAGSALEGAALTGAQFVGEGESRAMNTAVGAGLGAAMPLAISGAVGAAKRAPQGLQTILSRFSDLDEAALAKASDPDALKAAKGVINRTGGDLSGMADDLRARVGQASTDEAQAIASVNARRQAQMQGEILGAAPGGPIAGVQDVSPYRSGMRIQEAAQAGNTRAGQQFGDAQAEILGTVPGSKTVRKKVVPTGPSVGQKGLEFGGPEGDQNAFELAVDSFLADAGVGRGGRQYGVIGNVSIPPGAINEIRAMKETFKTALNARDMLDQLRLVDNRINFGGAEGGRLFARGSQEDLAIKSVRARLDDALEAQIGKAAGKMKGDVLAAWSAHREAFSNTRKALETIQDGLGAGNVNQEGYINRIKNIGVDDLRRIAEQARTDQNIAPVWRELQKGFYDAILSKGIVDDGLDFTAMKKAWDSIDDDLKLTMLPYQIAGHVDDVLSRTRPIDFKGQTLAETNRMAGKDRQALIGSLENIGSKAKRSDLADLEKLDDLLGLQGADRISEQAKSFYLGKQMGMTERGKLPMFTGSRTGGKLAGAAIGGAVGGATGSGQGGEGAAIGTPLGIIAGIALQSPAGALAAYKMLNKMRQAGVLGERNIVRPLARAGITTPRASRALVGFNNSSSEEQ